MARIELRDLLAAQTFTPAQDILFNYFYSIFDAQSAGSNRHITNVEPVCYQGASAGSEFLTYAATKMYIAFKLGFGYLTTIGAAGCIATLYNEANVAFYYCQNNDVLYDTGAGGARYSGNTYVEYDTYFSRVALTTYTQLMFIGYRFTLD